MKNSIFFYTILYFTIILSACNSEETININNDNLNINIDNIEFPNFGLYGFYINQTVGQALKNAKERKCNITISYPYIDLNSISYEFKDNLIKFKEDSMFLSTHFSGPRVPKKYLNFNIDKFNTPLASTKNMEEIFGNLLNKYNDVKNKELLKYMNCNISIELPQFKIGINAIIENNNLIEGKIYLIAFTDISENVINKMLKTMKERYGEGNNYNYITNNDYNANDIIWSKNKNETYAVYSIKTKQKEVIRYLGLYSPEASYKANKYYDELLKSNTSNIGGI